MPTIRASCTDCGGVELRAADLHVRVCDADDHGTYLFRCPHCRMTVVKPARNRTIDLLLASGVTWERWSLPLELVEPRGSGRPIDHDDLLDFHQQLAHDHLVWEELASLGR